MRTNDSQYVVKLTTQLVGSQTLSGMKSLSRIHPDAIYLLLVPRLKAKVSQMNNETLGRICGYGYTKNFSEPLDSWSGFIFKTGIDTVRTPHAYDHRMSGRELLEEVAICTIVAVACDIIQQPDFEEARRQEKDVEDQFDRGMRDYLHHGNAQ